MTAFFQGRSRLTHIIGSGQHAVSGLVGRLEVPATPVYSMVYYVLVPFFFLPQVGCMGLKSLDPEDASCIAA